MARDDHPVEPVGHGRRGETTWRPRALPALGAVERWSWCHRSLAIGRPAPPPAAYGIISEREREGMDRVLNAAVLTDVATVVNTLLTLLCFLMRAGFLGEAGRLERFSDSPCSA